MTSLRASKPAVAGIKKQVHASCGVGIEEILIHPLPLTEEEAGFPSLKALRYRKCFQKL